MGLPHGSFGFMLTGNYTALCVSTRFVRTQRDLETQRNRGAEKDLGRVGPNNWKELKVLGVSPIAAANSLKPRSAWQSAHRATRFTSRTGASAHRLSSRYAMATLDQQFLVPVRSPTGCYLVDSQWEPPAPQKLMISLYSMADAVPNPDSL